MKGYAIPPDVACATVEGGAVVLHMGSKRYFSLNETGAAIWLLLEAGVPLADVPRRLGESHDVAVDAACEAVRELVAQLSDKHLLVLEPE